MQVTLNLTVDSGAVTVPITYSGDSRIVYTSADIAAVLPDETIGSSLLLFDIGLYPAVFSRASTTQEWEQGLGEVEGLGTALFFVNLVTLLDQNDPRFEDRQVLSGVDTHVVSGKLGRSSGMRMDGDVRLLIGVEDGLLLQVEASGSLPIDGSVTTAFGNLTSDEATFTATLSLFDHGKEVPVVLPEFAMHLFAHQAVDLDDGRILVSGGSTGVANNNFIAPFPLPFVQVYDPAAETWTFIEPLEGYSVLSSVVKLADGRVLLSGAGAGGEGEEEHNAASLFDPADDSWNLLPGEPALRVAPNLVLLADGRVLAVGGVDLETSMYSPDPSAVVEVFDPETGLWDRKAAMPSAFTEQSIFALPDGRALVIGHPEDPFDEEDATWIYDPDADAWEPLDLTPESAPAEVAFFLQRPGPAILLRDGRLLITGATEAESLHNSSPDLCNAGFPEQADLLIPDPCHSVSTVHDVASGTTAFTGPVSRIRTGHTLTLLRDGRVLATGGLDPGNPFEYTSELNLIATTEIFDPATDTWMEGPELAEPRYEHTATLLPDGRVLLVGGIGQEKEPNPPGSEKEVYPLNHTEILGLGP